MLRRIHQETGIAGIIVVRRKQRGAKVAHVGDIDSALTTASAISSVNPRASIIGKNMATPINIAASAQVVCSLIPSLQSSRQLMVRELR